MMRVVDIVCVVQDVHNFLKIDEAYEFPVKVHDVKKYLESQCSVVFRLFDRVPVKSSIYGRLLLYKGTTPESRIAEIVIADDLNQCWSRFVACKELAHLLIDTDEKQFTTDPIHLIDELVTKMVFFPDIDEDIPSEYLALVAAIELLIPWRCREKVQSMNTSGMTFYEIAGKLKVPEKIIELWFSDMYQVLMRKAWIDM